MNNKDIIITTCKDYDFKYGINDLYFIEDKQKRLSRLLAGLSSHFSKQLSFELANLNFILFFFIIILEMLLYFKIFLNKRCFNYF